MSEKPKAGSRGSFPDLGALDVCLNVKDLRASIEFYERLGFREVEGEPAKGWSVHARDRVRIGLFHGFIPKNTLNFRGGDIGKIVEGLKRRGLKPYDIRLLGKDGTGNAMLKDPDGNPIFFDSTPKERRARLRASKRR
jgi:lactoylglutathione lyase